MAIDTAAQPAEFPPGVPHTEPHRHERKEKLLNAAIVRRALAETFLKLTPRTMAKAPVLFVVYVGSIWSTVIFLRDVGHDTASQNVFLGLVLAFVWFV